MVGKIILWGGSCSSLCEWVFFTIFFTLIKNEGGAIAAHKAVEHKLTYIQLRKMSANNLYRFKNNKKSDNDILCSSNLLWKCTGGLTVGLLVAGTSSRSSELLGLAATWIGNQQGPVVLDQDVLDLFLRGLIHICRQKTLKVSVQIISKVLLHSAHLGLYRLYACTMT